MGLECRCGHAPHAVHHARSGVSRSAGCWRTGSRGDTTAHDAGGGEPQQPAAGDTGYTSSTRPRLGDTDRHDADGRTLRYRQMPSILEKLDEAREAEEVEINHLCLLAVEEPGSVEEALQEPCWRRAMEDELGAI